MLKISRILRAADASNIASKFPPQLIELINKFNEWGEFYIVGGAVRDALMGRTPKDFDLMVVNPSPEEFSKIIPVKKVETKFPVYLYDTKDPVLGVIEIACARTETKTGEGYGGFDFEIVNDVRKDLARRDLNINSLAWSPTTGLVSIDDRPYEDLENQKLRHVTEAFREDPIRVLRAARFSSQLPGEWSIDPETMEMMKSLKGEVAGVSLNKVRPELEKALMAPKPGNFFLNLHNADCMDWFPEVDSNLSQCVALINRMAKALSLVDMYYMLAQVMQSPGDIKNFCKRLDLAYGREMELWHFITHCSFTTPEDYLSFFRGGKGGKLTFELIYPLMQKVGLNQMVTKLQAVEKALKGLDYKTVKPQEIPKLMRDTVLELFNLF